MSGALGVARKAVALAPHRPKSWLALGVASYRCGDWSAAEAALQHAQRFKAGAGMRAEIACFLAMAQWRCGKQAEARECYQHAVRLMERSFDARDLPLRAEAAAVLGDRALPTVRAREDAPRKD